MLAQHRVDPGGRGAARGQFLDNPRERAEAKLKSAEAAWLDDAKDADTVVISDAFRQHVARGYHRVRTVGEGWYQRLHLLQQCLFSIGQWNIVGAFHSR
jgi:hypothetical protein